MSALSVQARPRFGIGFATHAGMVRSANEDNYYVSAEAGIFVVADGMGGHEGGALASHTIVTALATIGSPVSAADLLARFEDRILRANASLQQLARSRGAVLGSTLAALLTYGDDFACVWSGDSRVYRIRDGAIAALSRDHTEARELVERGVLTEEEAKTWPRRHVITRAIGVRPEPELEMVQGAVEPSDAFLICSDGLTAHVGDDEMLDHVRRADAQAACDALLALTLERGGTDNVTVVILAGLPAPPGLPAAPDIVDDRNTTRILPQPAARAISGGPT